MSDHEARLRALVDEIEFEIGEDGLGLDHACG